MSSRVHSNISRFVNRDLSIDHIIYVLLGCKTYQRNTQVNGYGLNGGGRGGGRWEGARVLLELKQFPSTTSQRGVVVCQNED